MQNRTQQREAEDGEAEEAEAERWLAATGIIYLVMPDPVRPVWVISLGVAKLVGIRFQQLFVAVNKQPEMQRLRPKYHVCTARGPACSVEGISAATVGAVAEEAVKNYRGEGFQRVEEEPCRGRA
jgi:hypothetical protein